MKCVVLLVVFASAVLAAKQQQESFNVDTVLSNPRVLNAYLKCVLGTGPCTKEGREMKRLLPEVVRTACKSCSTKDKVNLRKFLRRVEADPKLADAWRKVLEKYDPHRLYRDGLEKFVNADYD
ncbi:ejaculatory bulb-specific protein 3-like [Macrosteles quadrilineatus]|uniref:ejaculatory bulb-specific protein 3-like n=1 Tax=Macrosteles quadrilineatus TaxID=74068 RepID=UPI0023E1B09E|nr:ejaculatory bulb-specific protein 3-like [Macrosteles quadrilineatus]